MGIKCLAGRLSFIVSAIVFCNPVSWAHDVWIEPSTYHPAVGSEVTVKVFVGQNFDGTPFRTAQDRLNQFAAVLENGKIIPLSFSTAGRTAKFIAEDAGLALLEFWNHPDKITLTAEQFEGYLKVEGLDHKIVLKSEKSGGPKEVTELYSRCVKAVMEVGSSSSGFDHRIGCPLEIIPEKNFYDLQTGDAFSVQLLFQNEPLEAALVTVMLKEAPQSSKLVSRSDAQGRASFSLTRPGIWMIKSIHMIPAQDETDADWESFWVSITFEVSN